MPSRNCQAGDTIFVRATVLEAGSNYFQVLIEDNSTLSVTAYVPASECAKHEDIGQLKPIHRTGAYLDR
jgi:hypothetical protein